ncbi:MAG: creatininase family protein [Desulfurococcales archaeon]|nr:creatininase family protein [Desulfurococcales archaeon]
MAKRLAELTGKQVDQADLSIALLPVGAIERHGNHMALGTDTYTAVHIAERVADEIGAVVLPPVWYGSCTAMRRHRGTFDIDMDALSNYVSEILREAWRNGVKLLVIINGHGGNTQALHYAAKSVSRQTGLAVTIIDWWRDVAREKRRELFSYPGHAGEDETSAMLAINKDLVDMESAEGAMVEYPPFKLYYQSKEEEIYAKAVTGDPSIASAEKGIEWLNAVVSEIVAVIRELKKYTGIN